MKQAKNISEAISTTIVHIVGPNRLQNELLTRYLEKKLGLPCYCGKDDDLKKITTNHPAHSHLILLDCFQIHDLKNWSNIISMRSSNSVTECIIALFNVNPESGLERLAVEQGIHGIFYMNDPINTHAKGVKDMLNGELWYSRKAVNKFLMEQHSFAKLSKTALNSLTIREKEILANIAAGAGNKEIARTLCISLHTVKSHIYNIYKKIKVSNRLQAALWTAQYL